MKLLYCPFCNDIRKFRFENTVCYCGKSWGNYKEDGLFVEVYGRAIVLGIDNYSLGRALKIRDAFPKENLTIGAWIISEPSRHVKYNRKIK